MKPLLVSIFLLATLGQAISAEAQQAQDFGDYVVHYNAFTTDMLTPEVGKAYNIQRSPNRALLTISVLKKVMDTPGTPVPAKVSASGTNLTGQLREVPVREIREDGAIYYLGEFPVHNLETYMFTVNVDVEGEKEPLVVKFKQQFYTE